MTPETHRDIWQETLYHRCDTLPAGSRLLFGELTSVMLSLDAALRGCAAAEPPISAWRGSSRGWT